MVRVMADRREGPRACSVMSDPLRPQGLKPARLLCPWDSPGKGTGGGLPFPPPGDLPHLGIEPASVCLLYRQADSLPLRHLESLAEMQGFKIQLQGRVDKAC